MADHIGPEAVTADDAARHFRKAEEYLNLVESLTTPRDTWLLSEVSAMQRQGLIHAVLALAARTSGGTSGSA
jgi:hypothetical protein